jgi:hypothetical protein
MDKKPVYQKPAIIYKEKIEARAGACGGGKATSGTCVAPITS